MRKQLSLILMTLLVLTLLTLAGCGGNSSNSQQPNKTNETVKSPEKKPIVLKYAFFAPATTFPAKQMEKWKAELEKRTNGQVKVDLFVGGTLLNAQNMYGGVQDGVADIGLSATSYEPGRFPLLGISELPSGYPNSNVASKVFYDLIKEFPPVEFKDYKIITAFCTEPGYIMVKKPVANLKDLKGRKIRISGSLTPTLNALGAAPLGMPMSEVPEALQTGVVEGLVTSREVLMDMKLAESLKYYTDYPLGVTNFIAVMNKDTWNSLPPDVQKVIDELAPEMAKWTGEYMDNHVKESLAWSQKEQGLQVTSLSQQEKDIWASKVGTIQDKYVAELQAKGLPADQYKKRLYELVKQYSNEGK